MSKKQKRQISQGVNQKPQGGTAPSVRTSTPGAASYSRRMAGQAEFKPDYTHVIADLKRIGMLAGSFFVILIVLSFFLK